MFGGPSYVQKKPTNSHHIVHFKIHQIGYSYLNGVLQKGVCKGKIIAFLKIFVLLPFGISNV